MAHVGFSENTCNDITAAIGLSLEDKNSNCTALKWERLIPSYILPTSSTCQVPGSTDSGIVIASFETKVSPSKVDDFSLYDTAVGIPGPFVVVVTETNDIGVNQTSTLTAPRFVCIPADNVVAGSRALPESPSTTTGASKPTKTGKDGAAGKVEGMGTGIFAVVGLTVFFLLNI
jgi:hypothetical protein